MVVVQCAHCGTQLTPVFTVFQTDVAIAEYMAHMVEHHWDWMVKGKELHQALVNGNISGEQFAELVDKTNAEEQLRIQRSN